MFEKLSDSEKVLAFIEVANEHDIKFDEQLLDSYIYLLKVNCNIPFGYSFVFHPLPYSNELRQDLMGLKMAGYAVSGSILVTDKGKKWIQYRQTIIPDFKGLIERIGEFVSGGLLDPKGLADAVYARITV